MSLARPLLTFTLTYMNYLASRPPPAPQKNGTKSMDSRRDIRFVKIASIAVTLAQAALTLASLNELLVIVATYKNGFFSEVILSLLVMKPQQSVAVSNIGLTPLAYIGWVSGTAGSLLRYWAINSLGSLFTFQLAVSNNHKLVKTGPYACVRHPGYAGSILSSIGTSIYFFGPGSYAYECAAWRTIPGIVCTSLWAGWKLFMLVNLFRRTKREDEFLRREFGGEWVSWKNQVRYRLIPGIY